MKVVSPYRPFAPESTAHHELGPFDWVGALRMLTTSVERSCGCETVVLTDVDTALPLPTHAFVTTHRRLMLWMLEVAGCYLASDAFDQDTVMVCPDILVLGDLRPFFQADLGMVVRLDAKFIDSGRPLLNSVQWWAVAAKDRLVAFYREALQRAECLSDNLIRWGADTVPLVELLSPLAHGVTTRAGLTVALFDQSEAMVPFRRTLLEKDVDVDVPLLDFKCRRKLFMRSYFTQRFGANR